MTSFILFLIKLSSFFGLIKVYQKAPFDLDLKRRVFCFFTLCLTYYRLETIGFKFNDRKQAKRESVFLIVDVNIDLETMLTLQSCLHVLEKIEKYFITFFLKFC